MCCKPSPLLADLRRTLIKSAVEMAVGRGASLSGSSSSWPCGQGKSAQLRRAQRSHLWHDSIFSTTLTTASRHSLAVGLWSRHFWLPTQIHFFLPPFKFLFCSDSDPLPGTTQASRATELPLTELSQEWPHLACDLLAVWGKTIFSSWRVSSSTPLSVPLDTRWAVWNS